MEVLTLNDIDIYDVGNTIQLSGAMYSGNGRNYILVLPDEDSSSLDTSNITMLQMNAAEWDRFLLQSDVLDIRGPAKAILRKSQRQIDQNVSWAVYERDGYICRYCARRVPLTVDHIVLWEEGGPSVERNLITSCRRCNKLRGSRQYDEWLRSDDYKSVSENLDFAGMLRNDMVVQDLPELRKLIRPALKGRTR